MPQGTPEPLWGVTQFKNRRSRGAMWLNRGRMFQPLPLFVGLRYVRARTQKFFVSFITWVSLVGVCLGVAALIVILSVMNGFEGELRGRLLALSAHARIVVAPGQQTLPELPVGAWRERWQQIAETARARPEVLGAAPYVEIQALAMHSPEMLNEKRPSTLSAVSR